MIDVVDRLMEIICNVIDVVYKDISLLRLFECLLTIDNFTLLMCYALLNDVDEIV